MEEVDMRDKFEGMRQEGKGRCPNSGQTNTGTPRNTTQADLWFGFGLGLGHGLSLGLRLRLGFRVGVVAGVGRRRK